MNKAFFPLLIVAALALVVILQFGFIFLLLALLPSVVAFYTDIESRKSAFQTVLSCNLAATLPMLVPMLEAGVKMRHYDTSAILNSPSTWLLVYSGAAAGWGLIYICRFIARFIVVMFYEYNIAMLEGQQKRLLDEWGQQIKHPLGKSGS